MTKTLVQEMIDAAQGTWKLLRGKRDAATHFDLSLTGLTGAMIALIIALTANAYASYWMEAGSNYPSATAIVFVFAIQFVAQMGFAFLALRRFGREDGFVPFLVCDGWTTFFTTVIIVVATVLEMDSGLLVTALVIAAFIVSINIARLVVTLPPMQIVGFLVAQFIGVLITLPLIGLLFPESLGLQPELLQPANVN